MTLVYYLREFINERLTAAAEEIFRVFEKMVIDYEEEIDRQRRLLDIAWKPEIKLHRIELPQQHVCKEKKVLAEQQLCIEERNPSVEQEEPEPPEIKEEEEELCSSQEGEQLEVKQKTDDFMLIPPFEESDHSEDESLSVSISECQNVVEENFINYIVIKNYVVPEPDSDHQLFSHNSHEAGSRHQVDGKHRDSSSTRNAEQTQQNHNSNSHINSIYNPTISAIHSNTHTGKMSLKCDTCGKDFPCRSALQLHLRRHTGEKPYPCNTCGKRFTQPSVLKAHIRTHTGERPHACNTCGKRFTQLSALNAHKRVHTGEKPYSCKTCGKDFRCSSHLRVHTRIHTGEKPYSCNTCGERFCRTTQLKYHARVHTGDRRHVHAAPVEKVSDVIGT